MMAELNGKMYEKFCCIEVSRINEQATLQAIIEYVGMPDYDTERFKYGIVSGIFIKTEDKDQVIFYLFSNSSTILYCLLIYLHCQLFICIVSCLFTLSAVCLHCKLFIYIVSCLFTLSAICLPKQ